MSPTPLLLNVEPLIGGYLKEVPGVKALEARVVSKTPGTTDKPWVRITLLDSPNETGTRQAEHLMAYYLQLDCYAGTSGGREEAFAVVRAVRAALVDLPEAQPFEEAVVTDVAPISMPRIPDPDLGGRERYILDVAIYMHPKP
jgi:hypothetical protein